MATAEANGSGFVVSHQIVQNHRVERCIQHRPFGLKICTRAIPGPPGCAPQRKSLRAHIHRAVKNFRTSTSCAPQSAARRCQTPWLATPENSQIDLPVIRAASNPKDCAQKLIREAQRELHRAVGSDLRQHVRPRRRIKSALPLAINRWRSTAKRCSRRCDRSPPPIPNRLRYCRHEWNRLPHGSLVAWAEIPSKSTTVESGPALRSTMRNWRPTAREKNQSNQERSARRSRNAPAARCST